MHDFINDELVEGKNAERRQKFHNLHRVCSKSTSLIDADVSNENVVLGIFRPRREGGIGVVGGAAYAPVSVERRGQRDYATGFELVGSLNIIRRTRCHRGYHTLGAGSR